MKDGQDEYSALPKATLEVLGKQVRPTGSGRTGCTRLEGVAPPADSAVALGEERLRPGRGVSWAATS